MGIVLSMTVLFWSNYLKELQLRKEKEELINTINYATSYAKSTNYYHWERFSNLTIALSSTGVAIYLDTLTWTWFTAFTLSRSEISFLNTPASTQVTVLPYQRACVDATNGSGFVSFQLTSTAARDNAFCFDRDMELCKLFIVSCP